jgi:c-di-GMP-binding flagellar brake protein YcgR
MDGEMELDDPKFVQMRKYSRVDTYIPVDLRLVPPDERSSKRSRTSVESALTTMQALPELDSEPLSEALKILNAKLDTIISMLTFQSQSHQALQFTEVNLSAGGMSLRRVESYNEGDFLEVKMIFPTIPYVIFYVYGEVVHAERECTDRYRVFVEFKEIDEDIRDLIAKYVFERQREILRKKKRRE